MTAYTSLGLALSSTEISTTCFEQEFIHEPVDSVNGMSSESRHVGEGGGEERKKERKKERKRDSPCVTYAPNRIQMAPMREPNITMKPMKSQRRTPAGTGAGSLPRHQHASLHTPPRSIIPERTRSPTHGDIDIPVLPKQPSP